MFLQEKIKFTVTKRSGDIFLCEEQCLGGVGMLINPGSPI